MECTITNNLTILSNAMTNNKVRAYRFWIMGAGHFGQLAISRITRRFPQAVITVVDRCPVRIPDQSITFVRADAIPWLVQMLVTDAPVDMLVPAVPEHVVAGWLSVHLENRGLRLKSLPIPEAWLLSLPHAMRGKHGQVFVSHADFLCPDNCPEPKDRCTHTGKPRPVDMFRLLDDFEWGEALPIVLRSHQILPGVGGIYPADLWHALDLAHNIDKRPLIVATACRCHGVVNYLGLQ